MRVTLAGVMTMGRISKDPAIRKQELVMAACELFKEKGFEQVSVSDVVKKVGVAQGTFYYYFRTKYDVLDAVVDHYMQESLDIIQKIAGDRDLNAQEKLQAIINYTFKIGEGEKNFIEFLHSDENLITHQKYLMKSFEATIPPISAIVEEGVREGLFEVPYPRETVELMVYMYGYLHDSLAHPVDSEEHARKMRAAEGIFTRVLGIKNGGIKLNYCIEEALQ
jgi:AcrR family transcriptional regulator